ncbi:hypothetical protein BD413DRAFT_207448 [Trametes elegans]|nr:hypothetical protein BD413DRAFT_207448 [Trametes elegans]
MRKEGAKSGRWDLAAPSNGVAKRGLNAHRCLLFALRSSRKGRRGCERGSEGRRSALPASGRCLSRSPTAVSPLVLPSGEPRPALSRIFPPCRFWRPLHFLPIRTNSPDGHRNLRSLSLASPFTALDVNRRPRSSMYKDYHHSHLSYPLDPLIPHIHHHVFQR